jgi:hypothetical protein
MTTNLKETLMWIEIMIPRLATAVDQVELKLTPKEWGEAVRQLGDLCNKTGDMPSIEAIKVLLSLGLGRS